MRILYFHQHFSTPVGSTGTRSYEFARALIERGHRVTMCCGQHALSGLALSFDSNCNYSRGEVDGIDVIAFPLPYSNRDPLWRRALTFLRFGWRCAALALEEKYDLLFATSTPLTAALPGIAMKLFGPRRPFVFEVRDLWPELPRALGMTNSIALAAMGALEWLAYHTADGCVALAPGIADGIRRRSPPDLPIEMIPNGCDLNLFDPALRVRGTLPGVAESDFVAGFTGAHGNANGLESLIALALELRRRRLSDIKLVLIGDGNQKASLMERAAAEKLDNLVFMAPIGKHQIAPITAGFDCGLMVLKNVPAFYFGTSPNKFFDYISSGLPVVNNYPGWLAELIVEHGCGISVAPDDPAAFADALELLAKDRPLRSRMGANARQLAADRFDRRSLAASFVEFLERVALPT